VSAAFTLHVRLAPAADGSTLLRVVSVLHRRQALVARLDFDADEATVVADLVSPAVGAQTLCASLDALVDVLEVSVHPERPPANDSGQRTTV
jgi:hypothetical protein